VTAGHRAHPVEPAVPVFPPALVGVLRDRFASKGGCLAEATDDVIAQLLTTVFFAGLETYEGERNPIGVAFLGRSRVDFALSEGAESAGALLYQWKILQFESPRPFAIGELVKLAVAGVDRRIYSAVRMLEDGTLVISGLAREGLNTNPGPVAYPSVAAEIFCSGTSAERSSQTERMSCSPSARFGARSRRLQVPPAWTATSFPTTSMPSVLSCTKWRRMAGEAS
jgi:hypothetical protein